MPSKAYINFLHIRMDVLKLIETHAYFSSDKPGRRNLGHLTRSAVVMLCAAWERYNEDLLLEVIDYLCEKISDVNQLNTGIRKTLSKKVTSDKHIMKPIELAGDGWKEVWKKYAEDETKLFNTPKGNKLRSLYNIYLGIDDYTTLWTVSNSIEIDNFVKDRGNIAHNGNKASYIIMDKLRKYQDMVITNVINIDSNMIGFIKNLINSPDEPWIQEYYKDIKNYK